MDNPPVFMGTEGRMRPIAVTEKDFYTGRYDDPFADMTYAIIKVGSSPARLEPTLDY